MIRRTLAIFLTMVLLFTAALPAFAASSGKTSNKKSEVSKTKDTGKKAESGKSTKKSKKSTKKSTKKTSQSANGNKSTASRSTSGFDAQDVIRFALDLKGVPYRSSGTTPKGFDCSGFTMYVFKHSVDIDLPHSSGAQAEMGQALKRSELVPGALVYFNTSGNRVSHVGIYIGDDKFIDSSNSKGVAINSLNDSYWGSRYLGARLVK